MVKSMHWIDWLYYRPGLALAGLWLLWALSWIAAMLWSSRPEKRATFG